MKRLAFALVASSMIGAAPPSPAGSLDIYFIDAMGGAATLIVTPERESILIDSGCPPQHQTRQRLRLAPG